MPRRIKSAIKKNKAARTSVPFQQAQHVGILFTMTRLDEFEAIRKFEKRLKDDGKKVEVLSFLPKTMENFHFHYDIFQLSDFGPTGNIKAENIQSFVNKPFDYLICLDINPNDYLRYIMAASKAKLRIGAAQEEWNPIFDLAIGLNSQTTVDQMIQQIIHYTSEFNG
jgi:hypothetical protein